MSDASSNCPTEFDRFRALTKRILTTPKTELMKRAKHKPTKRSTKKRK
jgi:hypothetical protein